MIMDKFGVDRLWSYSRFNTYYERPWEYYLAYIKKVPRGENIYTQWGTTSHEIIQDFYEDKMKYEDMITKFEEAVLDWRLNSHLKFMSENVEHGYLDNLRDYFQTTEVIPHKVINEKPVCIKFHDDKRDRDIVFIGYIDSEYTDENGVLNIVDYKTSSKSGFSGAKLKDHSRQLKFYALGVSQFRGIPLDKIRLRYDLMKYVEVSYMQKNGKLNKSKQERRSWVDGMKAKMRKELAALDFDPIEVDEAVNIAISNNNMDNLPKEVQDKFGLGNCYIDVTIDEDEAEELRQLVCEVVAEVEEKEALPDLERAFPEPNIIGTSDQFYYETLASHLLPYAEKYQEQKNLYKNTSEVPDDDLLALFK